MICKACKKEFNQYDSPICENCIRKIWDKSNESNTNTWVQYFNVKKPPTLKQKKHLANLYRGFEFDENENYSIHKDFPGHNIEHGAENTCSCGNRCDVLSKYNEFLKILPYNSLHTSPIIYVLKGIRDQYRVDQSKIPFEQIKGLWDPRLPPHTKETNPFLEKLSKKFLGKKEIVEWPGIRHYIRSITQKEKAFTSKKFQNAEFQWKIPNVLPISIAGQFSLVLLSMINGEKKAIRFFTDKKDDIEYRYENLDEYFKKNRLIEKIPELVNFNFYKDELKITTKSDSGKNSKKYPLIEMDWVEGISLDVFIQENLKDSSKLTDLAVQFFELICKLESNKIAHGDLHPRNIIIDTNQKIKLVDYDCFFIPNFKEKKSPESGDPDFQHPLRQQNKGSFPKYNELIDRFSAIIIYLSILVLAKKPDLFDEKHAESILFSAEIFHHLREGNEHELIKKIENIKDSRINILMKNLLEYIKDDSPEIKSLDEIIKNTT